MNALEATGVCRAYGKGAARCEVLRDLSVSLAEGEFVALMGPSGSGKSTFLHLAAGLILPDSGRIEVAGCDVTAMGDAAATRFRRRNIGLVFQAFNLVESLSVAENIVLPARLDHAKIDLARRDELIERLGLGGKAARLPGDLSGGERQRAAIARALFMRPALILADEPTGNLDAKSAHGFCELLRELNAVERSAILLVTHDPVVAAAAARVCFLKEGRVAASHPSGGDAANISKLYLECYR